MGKIKLVTKLTWGMVILMTCMVVLTTAGIAYGVYFLTEQKVRTNLIQDLRTVLLDHLTIEDDQIRQKDGDQGLALGAYLRAKDLSALIVDENGGILARYGIYKDLPKDKLVVEPVSHSKYADTQINDYGFFDTYTAPIKSGGKVFGYLRITRKNTEIDILRNATLTVVSVLLPLSWGLSLLIAYWMASWITLPMTRLVEYLERIKSDSMHSISDSPKMDYEVSVVTRAINDLIFRLREALNREHQITENISHEFKTPLTRIASNLQVGKIKEAEVEILELGGNVDALLSLAIWEKTNETCDLVPILNHLGKLIPKNINLIIELPKKIVIPLPYSHAIIIWKNILDNAIKHNVKGGYIKMTGSINHVEWNIEINNSAKLVKPDTNKITQRKYKFGQGAGYGIGMSIVADMCKLHDLILEISEFDDEVKVNLGGKLS